MKNYRDKKGDHMKKCLLVCFMISFLAVSQETVARSYWEEFKSILKSPYIAYRSYNNSKKISDIMTKYRLTNEDFKRIVLIYPKFTSYSNEEQELIVNSDASLMNLVKADEEEDRKLFQAIAIKFDELSERISNIEKEMKKEQATFLKAKPQEMAAIARRIDILNAQKRELCLQQEKTLTHMEDFMTHVIKTKNDIVHRIING
jgi:hypothetical protein